MQPATPHGALAHIAAQPQPQRQRLPLYMQISELLTREIAAGRWLQGERLPTEADLAARLGVAIGTLRKALAELEARGQIDRRQGSGTYVRRVDGQRSIYAFFHLELTAGGGGLPTADVLALDKIIRPDGMPALGDARNDAPGCAADGTRQTVWRVRRLRYLNQLPVAVEDICFGAGGRSALAVADLHESLYQFYQQHLGFWIAQVDDHVGLGQVPGWAPAAFSLAPGQSAVHVARRGWSQHGVLEEVSSTWFNPALACYSARWR